MASVLLIPFQFGIHTAVIVAIERNIRLTGPEPVNQIADSEGQQRLDHTDQYRTSEPSIRCNNRCF